MTRTLIILAAIVALLGLFLGGMNHISRLTAALATANGTIDVLQQVNAHQEREFEKLKREEQGLRALLEQQNASLAELDQQNRKTADELQEALATPPAGRPDCAREPLPGSALRLLQSASAPRGDNAGDQAPAAARVGAALPGT
ncbi:hypothetical protein [Aeromonas jandaei]|uniref:hypothetical protein n=1 Tax=Aeromonas jandaei TaxID=650 RepID=UPI001ADD6F9D|nr:hypothetical protein [Aeromonas jandaei]QTL95533.1 hypothetical protein AjGTCBM29_03452 [Aeromonas jandaei]